MTLTLTNVSVFVGVGGSLSDTTDGDANNTPDNSSDDEVNYDGGVGFYASLDSLTLVTLKDTNGTPQKSYLALDVSGVDAGFKGIDHLTLNVWDARIQVNQAKDSDATPPPKLDWTKFTNANTTGLQLPALAVDDKVDIKAAGNVAIDVDGFVQVFGSFAFSKLTNIEVTSVVSAGPSAGTPTQRTVNVMTFGLENVNVFVGAGPYFQDANDDGVADTDVHGDAIVDSDAIGLALHDVSLALALFKPTDHVGSYYAVRARADSVDLAGFDLGEFEPVLADGFGISHRGQRWHHQWNHQGGDQFRDAAGRQIHGPDRARAEPKLRFRLLLGADEGRDRERSPEDRRLRLHLGRPRLHAPAGHDGDR